MFKILEAIYNAEETRTLHPAAVNINIPLRRGSPSLYAGLVGTVTLHYVCHEDIALQT
jgi:hypothetical protein